MDEIVKQALLKWPHVPHCHGWLALDARGDWYMRDERTQAAGPFPTPKGSRIEHLKLREFIERNYAHDEAGAWFFQNGPQRVYVDLEAAPWVWRVQAAGRPDQPPTLSSHTGLAVAGVPRSCWLDDAGRLFLDTGLGFGLVHTQDMGVAADALMAGCWPAPQPLAFEHMAAHFGHCLRPVPAG